MRYSYGTQDVVRRMVRSSGATEWLRVMGTGARLSYGLRDQANPYTEPRQDFLSALI